ncbi:transposase [Hornefia porci]|uniref:Transposase n=2 Tax=Hornefia porci TaxID=2652292 RepID=A0A1Q9JFW0_9FIRM|nr:IS1634 family transposase [Hornefia porci]OLR55079.1 transposase [Hornefia porci]
MKLWYDRKAKDPAYFIQQGFRNGKKTSTRNVARIGKHSELLAITDDPLAYAREQVAKYNEEWKKSKVKMEMTINFDEKVKATDDPASASTLRNVGYFYLQQLYHDLQIRSFFQSVAADRKIEFDPDLVNRFLTYARILHPGSKFDTCRHLGRYYEQPDFGYQHILRTMDLMQEHYDEYISHLYEHSNNVVRRNTSICYYDCTNFYFEIESPDEDYVDAVTGEIIKGFRKYGFSKEHRPNPLVEMGLFMDADGIPLSMCLTSGSDNEQTTAIPLEQKLTKMFKGKPFIYCADAGLGSYNIRKFNSMGGRAFIITQSIRKLSVKLKQAVFNDCDYRLLSSDQPVSLEDMFSFDREDPKNRALYEDKAYKIIDADNLLDLGFTEEKKYKNGKSRQVKVKGTLQQKLIITFSRKMMEYQRFIRNRQVERAKELLKNIDPETYKKGPHDVTRFIKRTSKGKSGEKATDRYALDKQLIAEEEKYDGFYAIATNLDDDAQTIIDINSMRHRIEDCFRVMKTNFSGRPVYHHNEERITAHFMICYTALLIYQLLEKKLDDAGEHFTTENIIETLQNMNVANVQDMYYMAIYNGSRALTALNGLYPLDLDRKNYLPKELNKKIRKISK